MERLDVMMLNVTTAFLYCLPLFSMAWYKVLYMVITITVVLCKATINMVLLFFFGIPEVYRELGKVL